MDLLYASYVWGGGEVDIFLEMNCKFFHAFKVVVFSSFLRFWFTTLRAIQGMLGVFLELILAETTDKKRQCEFWLR